MKAERVGVGRIAGTGAALHPLTCQVAPPQTGAPSTPLFWCHLVVVVQLLSV